jgi:hypothetical protein
MSFFLKKFRPLKDLDALTEDVIQPPAPPPEDSSSDSGPRPEKRKTRRRKLARPAVKAIEKPVEGETTAKVVLDPSEKILKRKRIGYGINFAF